MIAIRNTKDTDQTITIIAPSGTKGICKMTVVLVI